MQTCKYSQPGPRAAFVAAGLALLACLLAVGIQPSAAGRTLSHRRLTWLP